MPHQLLVTTSYDLALERGVPRGGRGVRRRLLHRRRAGTAASSATSRPTEPATLIEVPNTYATELSLERRTVILKLHGQVDRGPEREWESFVVTEDDYIDYLAQTDVAGVSAGRRSRRSSGAATSSSSATRWPTGTCACVLNRLWGDQPLSYRSWAVQPEAKPLEREFWRRRDVDVLEMPLEEYVETLGRHADALTEVPA